MTTFQELAEMVSVEENSGKIDVLEAKVNVILGIVGTQFIGFLALIITLITQYNGN